MAQEIYDPLDAYVNVFKDRFRHVAEATFAQLAAESHVDVEANRKTCHKIYNTAQRANNAASRLSRWTMLCIVLWITVIVGATLTIVNYDDWTPECVVATGTATAAVLLMLFLRVHPKLSALRKLHLDETSHVSSLKSEALEQMEPLNRLYDWDLFTRMMAKTVPNLEFDPYFTTRRLAEMEHVYGWDSSFNDERSVMSCRSGALNGNPLVICRTRKMIMGNKTYTGYKEIFWETYEQDRYGNQVVVSHTETLSAEYTAPYPEYYELTRVIYGNTAAPDLVFDRRRSGLASKQGSLAFKWKKRKLRNKARNLSNSDYAMMTNEDYETMFDTSNRNSNQQYALLFTPMAQQSMTHLLQDDENGYGDDFDFEKNKMINIIVSGHLQELDLDMHPKHYSNFDYDLAEKNFYEISAQYFKAIYLALAPLLCIPMYRQMRSRENIYGRDMPQHSAFWEHEALANLWGEEHFRAPDCVTHCILKTEQVDEDGDESTIVVYAHGYRSEQRVAYIDVMGGDGRYHEVPVCWDEYIPVTGTGRLHIKEDNTRTNENATTQQQRLDHIDKVLSSSNAMLYRRHIASSL